jgi:Domain of unknown function (DUF5925)/ATPase family associated with various cellular activities (AAA)
MLDRTVIDDRDTGPAPAAEPVDRVAIEGAAGVNVAVDGGPGDDVLSVMNFDDADSLADVLDALVLSPFINGSQPWARTRRLDRVRADAPLLPAGVRPVRAVVGDSGDALLARGEGWTLRAVRWRGGGAEVSVTAISDELARSVLELATDEAVEPAAPDDESVEIGFWNHTQHGARRRSRRIEAATWSQIRDNYTAATATALDALVAVTPERLPGRLILLYGPPGTGKTTALRTLARAWHTWCQLDFVIDPECLFADPGYLTEVVVGRDEDERPWRLLLLEDCDELIRADAKAATGQALSRLLNLTDGMLGQGRQVLVAITTNEDIGRLHPAVIRPGRCLARIEVGRLDAAEASDWLRRAGVDARAGSSMTLAQLFALCAGAGPVVTPEPTPATGLYL